MFRGVKSNAFSVDVTGGERRERVKEVVNDEL